MAALQITRKLVIVAALALAAAIPATATAAPAIAPTPSAPEYCGLVRTITPPAARDAFARQGLKLLGVVCRVVTPKRVQITYRVRCQRNVTLHDQFGPFRCHKGDRPVAGVSVRWTRNGWTDSPLYWAW